MRALFLLACLLSAPLHAEDFTPEELQLIAKELPGNSTASELLASALEGQDLEDLEDFTDTGVNCIDDCLDAAIDLETIPEGLNHE